MISRINYSVSLQASLAVAGQGITAGQLVITNGTAWLLATTANLAANPGAQLCVSLDTSPAGGPFRALWIGAVPDDVARLGAGAQSFVGNDGSANMQRQSGATGAVGYCDATGLITFLGDYLASQIGAAGITSLTGDATATGPGAAATTVVKINGATVPAAGALTTGNVLQVSGASALSYGPVNLAGGSNYVTGVLPAGNVAALTFTGDVTGNTGATVVSAISGSSPIAITPNSLQWTSTAVPVLTQADVTTNSATGALSTHRAQNATGTTSIGGAIRLTSGTGTTCNGDVQFYAGATQRARIFEAQQHHLQLGDGGGDSTALQSGYFGIAINDTTYGTTALMTSSSFAIFQYPSTKGFLVCCSPTLALSGGIVPLAIDGTGNACFARGASTSAVPVPPSNTALSILSDAASTVVCRPRGFTGQSSNLIQCESSTPATVFEVGPTGNVGIGAAGSYGGGKGGVVAIATASTAPTAPAAGTILLFVQDGALKGIDSSGNITTVIP